MEVKSNRITFQNYIRCDICKTKNNFINKYCSKCNNNLAYRKLKVYYNNAEEPVNNNLGKEFNNNPKTIAELKECYDSLCLPPEHVTRFFIGKNLEEARVFGIYEDVNGNFVVYKNKDTGVRAVRYTGTDEAYAVNEFYQRLLQEIENQKKHGYNGVVSARNDDTNNFNKIRRGIVFFFILQIIVAISLSIGSSKYQKSYKYYIDNQDNIYKYTYYIHSDLESYWSIFDKGEKTYKGILDMDVKRNNLTSVSETYLVEHYNSYSSYYKEHHSSSSDSDYDYDSGGWDSGATDFGSDW